MTRSKLVGLVLATAALTACEKETTERPPGPDLADYLPMASPGTDAAIRFAVDSVTYDPAAGGTAVERSSQVWTLEPAETDSARERLFLITRRNERNEVGGQQFWRWELLSEGRGITSAIGGITYLSLTAPFTPGSTWDVLGFTQAGLVVNVEEEPIAIHKDWGATIDSVGAYRLGDGTEVESVFVTHADSENRIELRRVREVYGRGYGLLSRSVEILDSQDLRDRPWSEKAERGFTLEMRRLP